MNNNQIHEKKGIIYSLLFFIYTIIMSALVFVINSILLILKNMFDLFYRVLLETLFSISHTINIFMTVTLSNLLVFTASYISGIITAFLFFRNSKKSE